MTSGYLPSYVDMTSPIERNDITPSIITRRFSTNL